MVVDSLAPIRIGAGSICNPKTVAAEAENGKTDKNRDLINDRYIFQPIAFEVQSAAGPSTEIFLNNFFLTLCTCT